MVEEVSRINWISVDDRLPEHEGIYVVWLEPTSRKAVYEDGTLDAKAWVWHPGGFKWGSEPIYQRVTHWATVDPPED